MDEAGKGGAEILCPYCEEANFEQGQCPACFYFPLPNEGAIKLLKRTARRRECAH